MVVKPSKDKALEALDLIINVLIEHEKDLDKLIGKLGDITEGLGKSKNISNKIERIEENLASLHDDLTKLVNFKNTSKSIQVYSPRQNSLTVKCGQWHEFRTLATNAETISVLFEDSDKSIQVWALKNSRIFYYHGEFPQEILLLKLWLSKELDVSEHTVIEGTFDII